jgi:hypothetical protein
MLTQIKSILEGRWKTTIFNLVLLLSLQYNVIDDIILSIGCLLIISLEGVGRRLKVIFRMRLISDLLQLKANDLVLTASELSDSDVYNRIDCLAHLP